MKCPCCSEPLERMRYFPRQLLTADDMRVEQEYVREKLRRHNRYLHGWGVVCGCTIESVPEARTWQVRVCPGYVVGPQGDEISIDECVDVDLQTGSRDPSCTVRWPCPPLGTAAPDDRGIVTVYIAVRYAECFSRPVRVHPAGCGCDESGCEYSRTRESFEIKVLGELPQSHIDARKDDDEWCNTIRTTPAEQLARQHLFPVPPCPECVKDPWVVLGTVRFPTTSSPAAATASPGGGLTIDYRDRRVLLSSQRLQVAAICLP
jgi:hypothetical protein